MTYKNKEILYDRVKINASWYSLLMKPQIKSSPLMHGFNYFASKFLSEKKIIHFIVKSFYLFLFQYTYLVLL